MHLGRALTVVSLFGCLAGCAADSLVARFDPAGAVVPVPLVDTLTIAVGPEARPDAGRSSVGPGFLAWIPLIPYGHQRYAPELVSSRYRGAEGFRRDLADTVVADLRAAGIARRFVFAGESLPGLAPESSCTLQVTFTEGVYHRYLTLYGVSFAGAFLWFVGFPTSYGSTDLGLRAELLDPTGAPLGSEHFTGSESAIEWLYRPMGPAYSSKLPDAYEQISPGLRSFVLGALPQCTSVPARTAEPASPDPAQR